MIPRGSWFRPGILFPLLFLLGLLPLLPILLKGSPVLHNDMLVAYFCYFMDFHRNWSWDHPLVFWSSSYQGGMPMHAYWQTGYLYPLTWILFGPLPNLLGGDRCMHLFYAFHFALGILGFLALGPRLGLRRPASLWAGIAFALGGTMLARYEHATFLSGWAWMPLALSAFLALRDRPGPATLLAYAWVVALQALGGHPQASATTAILIGAFTLAACFRRRPLLPAAAEAGPALGILPVTQHPAPRERPGPPAPASRPPRRVPWILAGHVLALLYCAPLVIPFLGLADRTVRYDGAAWEGKAEAKSVGRKLEEGVFSFEKFSTGGFRPLHFLSLGAAHALGSPANASWWGGESWGEVFLYMGVLGSFFACFASWRRAGPDLRLLLLMGLLGLWLAFGTHLGASQILYEVPVLNNFRRPARYLILFALALAALSGHGFQRWTAGPRDRRLPMALAVLGLSGSAVFLALALRLVPEANAALLDAARMIRKLDPAKDYAVKLAALSGRLSLDFLLAAVSGLALWGAAKYARRPLALPALFAVLLVDLVRLHWDHFHLYPASFHRDPPASASVLDKGTQAFWRVSHYLEYADLEGWRMHNDPLASMPLFDREKDALSFGVHAVFGYRHVSAHLPLIWKWQPGTGPAALGGRYFFSNLPYESFQGDSLKPLGRFGEVWAYEVKAWRPRFQQLPAAREDRPGFATTTLPAAPEAGPGLGPTPPMSTLGDRSAVTVDPTDIATAPRPASSCEPGFQGWEGLCVREARDGDIQVKGSFSAGDTLLVRERAYPGWIYRVGQGPWRQALETPEHWLAVPLDEDAGEIRLAFVPYDFYRWAGAGAIATGLVAIFAYFRRTRRAPA